MGLFKGSVLFPGRGQVPDDGLGLGREPGDAQIFFQKPDGVTCRPLGDVAEHGLQVIVDHFLRSYAWILGALEIDKTGIELPRQHGRAVDIGDVEIDMPAVERVVNDAGGMRFFKDF